MKVEKSDIATAWPIVMVGTIIFLVFILFNKTNYINDLEKIVAEQGDQNFYLVNLNSIVDMTLDETMSNEEMKKKMTEAGKKAREIQDRVLRDRPNDKMIVQSGSKIYTHNVELKDITDTVIDELNDRISVE